MSEATGAVVGVYGSMKDADAAMHTLLEQRVPAGQVSILGQDPSPRWLLAGCGIGSQHD